MEDMMALVTIDITFTKCTEEQNSYEVDARIKAIGAYKGEREATETISIDFDQWKALDNTLKSLAARDAEERIKVKEFQVKEFGKSLFQQVIKGKVYTLYQAGKSFAEHTNAPLRVRFHLGYPELIELPWELLCEEGSYLVTTPRPRIMIIRCPTNIRDIKALERPLPLQIMIMAAEPNNFPAEADDEKKRIKEALKKVEEEGSVLLKEISGTDIELEHIYKNRALDIFHFIGHGRFNHNTGEGELTIADASGNVRHISAEKFSLSLPANVRLVFLNACKSASGNDHEAYSSIGYLLAKRGYVVIAMQFQISINAAIRFADSFYSEIAQNKSIEDAVAEARVRVFTMIDCNPLDWAAPVLYMQSKNGKLFELKEPVIVDDGGDTENGGSTELEPEPQARFLSGITDRWKPLPLGAKILTTAILLIFLIGGIGTTQIKEVDKGLELVGYCQSRHYASATPKAQTVNWKCIGGKSEKVDLAQLCNQDQHRDDLTPAISTSGVVSCNTSTNQNHGGLTTNLDQHCQDKGYDTYKDGFCTSPPSSDIDIMKACIWKYGSNANTRPPTHSSNTNPNSWNCHLRTFFGRVI
jgi:hypothetical protein